YKKNLDHKDIHHYLTLELADADAYYAQIVADEKLWISQNADVEALFQAKYYASSDAQFALSDYTDDKPIINTTEISIIIAISLLLLASISLYLLRRFLKNRFSNNK
ncbi:MAG: hypothetical protein HON92_12230, partial [Planctomycetaceae bacterium]|nr:hypothetical protein [Planctomycetaceae bacterium]